MVFEVVSGQVMLSMRSRFKELHRSVLIPACYNAGIEIVGAYMCDVGNLGRFLDIYKYDSYAEYEDRSSKLECILAKVGYYLQIQECIHGSISIELMDSFLRVETT